jgi:putative spermidine/putrescine transport system permease protein
MLAQAELRPLRLAGFDRINDRFVAAHDVAHFARHRQIQPPEPVDVTVVYAAGARAGQSVDAMAVVYMLTTLVWLLIALRFVDPTQVVTRAKREAAR